MRQVLLLIFFSLFYFHLQAQNEGNIWYFGDEAGIDFNSGVPVAITNSQMNTLEGCATICDANGNLLFYTDGMTVWSSNQSIMSNGTGLYGNYSATQSGVIVPQPGTSLYYVFTVDENIGFGLRYSIVDISANGGLGDVISKNNLLLAQSSEKVTAVNHSNGTDIWVVGHKMYSNEFYSYLITASGLNTTPLIQGVGSVNNFYRGYLKASPDGKHMALAVTESGSGSSSDFIEIFDFDPTSGTISNPITDNVIRSYGIEFSPSGQFIYLTTWYQNSKLYQYDLLAGSASTILASQTLVASVNSNSNGDNCYGALQIAPDGKIYCVRQNVTHISTISDPDQPGAACTWVDNAMSLNNKMGLLGLPTFIQSFFFVSSMVYSNFCFNDTTLFSIADTTGLQSVLWDFGDPLSGTSDTSTFFNTSHIYTSSGWFTVTLIFNYSTYIDTQTNDIFINPLPIVNLGSDTSICIGQSVDLNATTTNVTYLWQDGSSDSVFLNINASGLYWVELTDSNSCKFRDSIQINVAPLPAVDLGNDTTVCTAQSVMFDVFTPGYTYAWQDGSTGSSFAATTPGAYWVIVTDTLCSSSDTVNLFNYPPVVVDLGVDTAICEGSVLLLDVTNANATYLWQDGSTAPTFTVSVSGTYYVTAVVNGCIGSDTLTVVIDIPPLVNLGNDTIVCEGEKVLLEATPGYDYSWQDGSNQQTYLASLPGVYWVNVSDGICSSFDSILISNAPALFVDLGNDTTICEGTSLSMDVANPNAVYLWQDGSQGSSFTADQEGSYWVTVSANGCYKSDSIDVKVALLPIIDLGLDTLLCFGQKVTLDAARPEYYYRWQDGSSNETYSVSQPGLYYADAWNDCGIYRDSVNVSFELCGCEIFVPNAFTPNSDGRNDEFLSITGACDFQTFNLKVFNRWGQLVFESNDRFNGWDGISNGVNADAGTYAWYISYLANEDGVMRQFSKKGNVILLR